MNYDFETLNPESFQEFCQALIVREYPNAQCLPVGQRDGGRDALVYFVGGSGTEKFIVFQVKYVRKPMAKTDTHKWLTEILEEEVPKIKKLIPKGASQYILLTNVAGTSYPDSGSIDTAHKLITDSTTIPSQCWWREDLARRLDAYPEIKWSYPSLLSSGELLRYLLESGLTEDVDRRISAIRSFLRDQFQKEKEVRFKQVELQNQLLDLFIDVPLELRSGPRKATRRLEWELQQFQGEDDGPENLSEEKPLYGAAGVFLNGNFQERLNKVVLEGAPGQGKSTVVQYICQIHRRKILGEPMDIDGIPSSFKEIPVRLPFKVDLRDYSLWLSGRNPFSVAADSLPNSWNKSLESFLAAQVEDGSGGALFTVSDLHAVCRISSVLLVLDGLDEVAGIGSRKEVVDEVNRAINRLYENTQSLQSIITSRPTAFSNSAGFSDTEFIFCELNSISRPLIDEYAGRWIRARRLGQLEAADVRKILRVKLDQPHLRELARNPMQLAILLSLIHTRGSSLPDKRTALYDAYTELFFSRESEKSPIVREHRDLLIDIHRFLAWTLHGQAELSETSGIISEESLQALVRSYLESEGYDPELTEQLFTGMVERVVALVSRVQGTFEFEVQPLREYFAARHLYETAQYSPVGEAKNGTLPDRFDAISRNFYWLNVTRFYAGCYNKGELPSLVDRLEELSKDENFKLTRHPQELAATLLSDWVFAQHPKSMRALVALLLDGVGLRNMLLGTSRRVRRQASLVLPKGSGKEELINKCFSALCNGVPRDYSQIITDVVSENATRTESREHWLPIVKGMNGRKRTQWFEYGANLGVLSTLSNLEIDDLLSDQPDDPIRLKHLLHGGQRSYLEATESRFTSIVDAILSHQVSSYRLRGKGTSQFDVLSLCVDSYPLDIAFEYGEQFPMHELFERYRVREGNIVGLINDCPVGPYNVCQKIKRLSDIYVEQIELGADEWSTSITPWDRIVETGREIFGERWAFTCFANFAAGIKNRQEKCEDAANLLDHELSLCRRIRFARLKSGSPNWFAKCLEESKTEQELIFVLLIILSWSGPETLKKLVDHFDHLLEGLSEKSWKMLLHGLKRSTNHRSNTNTEIVFKRDSIRDDISERTAVVLAERATDSSKRFLFEQYLAHYTGNDQSIYHLAYQVAAKILMHDKQKWQDGLNILNHAYHNSTTNPSFLPFSFLKRNAVGTIPVELARQIVLSPDDYPCDIVTVAEMKCRELLSEVIVPVATVAENDKWFAN